MHNECTANGTPPSGADHAIWNGDYFLSQWVPQFLASSAFQQHGVLIIDWDEGEGVKCPTCSSYSKPDGPIPFLVISYQNILTNSGPISSTKYDHSSLTKTIEEILGINGPSCSQLDYTCSGTTTNAASDLQAMFKVAL